MPPPLGSSRHLGQKRALVPQRTMVTVGVGEIRHGSPYFFLITTQAKRNLSSRSGIGGVLSAT